MFVRFRQSRRRLQCSLIETRRVDGKVCHEHIASLGAIGTPPSIADRVSFWVALHERLGKLSNRLSHETQSKLFDQIHGRIPMPMADEQRQLQKENAEADERFWSILQGMNASLAADHRELAAEAQRIAADDEAASATAAANAEHARGRLAKIGRGDDVTGGLARPADFEAVRVNAGFTKRDLRRFRRVASLHNKLERLGIEDEFRKVFRQRHKVNIRRAEREAEGAVLHKHQLGASLKR